MWVLASCLAAGVMLFGNAESWSTKHQLAAQAAAMTLRTKAALAGLLYGGGCSVRALVWSLRRN